MSVSDSESTETTTSIAPLAYIGEYAEQNPLATEYYVETELEAQKILLAMAASIKHLVKDVKRNEDKATMLKFANQYRQAVIHSNALDYIRNMTEETQLEIYGLALKARRIILQ